MNLPVSEFSHLEKEDHPISSSLQQQQESSTNNHQTASMGLLLSEEDKLLILLAAFLLVVATVVVTSCLVLPRCYLYQRFLKPKQLISGLGLALGKLNEKAAAAADEGSNSKSTSKSSKGQCQLNASIVYPFFNSSGQQGGGGKNGASSESDHFHLSIVPVYGLQPQTRSLASSPVKHPSLSSSSSNGNSSSGNGTVAIGNQYENLTQLAEKTRLRYSSLKPDNLKALPCFPKVRARLRVELLEEPASSASAFRLHVTVDQVTDLKLKEYLCEPSVYVTGTLVAGGGGGGGGGGKSPASLRRSIIGSKGKLFLHTNNNLFSTAEISWPI